MAVLDCKRCGVPFKPSAAETICALCINKLTLEDVAAPAPARSRSSGRLKPVSVASENAVAEAEAEADCVHCAERIKAKARVCRFCGGSQEEEAEPAAEKRPLARGNPAKKLLHGGAGGERWHPPSYATLVYFGACLAAGFGLFVLGAALRGPYGYSEFGGLMLLLYGCVAQLAIAYVTMNAYWRADHGR